MKSHEFRVRLVFSDRTTWLPGEEERFGRKLELVLYAMAQGMTHGPIPSVIVTHNRHLPDPLDDALNRGDGTYKP